MARTTENTYLIHSTDGESYEKLVDIKDVSALGGAPNLIAITTMSHHQEVSLNGILKGEAVTCTCNYDLADFKKLKALEDDPDHYYAIQCGKEGEYGVFGWQGDISVWSEALSVDSAHDMKISIAPKTEIDFIEKHATITD